MNVSVKFVCDGSTNNGKIQLVVDYVAPTPGLVGDALIYWGLVDPNGVVLKQFEAPDPYPSPNWDGHYVDASAHDTDELLIDIPTGSDGNYVLGEYTISLYMKDSELENDDGAVFESNITYIFDFQTTVKNLTLFGSGNLAAEFNCLTGEITATDNTSLTGYTLIERVLRLTPPNVPGIPAPTTVTTGSQSLVEDFDWNNAYYQVSLSVKRSYEQDDSDANNDLITQTVEMLTAQSTLHVVCGTTMCDAAACLKEELVKIEDLACEAGSWAGVAQKDMAKAIRSALYGILSLMYKECGNYNAAAENAMIAADCDCGCGDDTASTAITPYTPPV